MKVLRSQTPTSGSSDHVSPDVDPSDAIWRALANPWRRRILDVLRESPRTTGELTEALGTSRHQLLVHLDVLRDADLVLTVAEGRVRRNHLNAVPLRMIHDRWLSQYESLWSDVLLNLRTDLEASTSGKRSVAPSTVRPAPTTEETSRAG